MNRSQPCLELLLAHDGLDLLQARLEALQLGDHHRARVVSARLDGMKEMSVNSTIEQKGGWPQVLITMGQFMWDNFHLSFIC